MKWIQLNNKSYEAGDNGGFAQPGIADALNRSVLNIRNEYGPFDRFNFSRCQEDEYMSFSYRYPLFKYLGLEEPRGDSHPNIYVYASVELGRGKKNLHKKQLKLRVDLSYYGKSSAPEEYKALKAMLGNKELVCVIEPITDEMIKDPSYIHEQFTKAKNEGIEKVRGMWKTIQGNQLARDIDFADVESRINEIFTKHEAPVEVETRNNLQFTTITISSPYDNEAGSLTIRNDGDNWCIESAMYTFNFVDNLFELPRYKYRSTIMPGKFDEFFGMIADELKRERDIRYQFAMVRQEFVSEVEKNS